MGKFDRFYAEEFLDYGGEVRLRIRVYFPSTVSCRPKAYFTRHTFGFGIAEKGKTRMKASLLAGLIFWGTIALVLSELITVSVSGTQTCLVWLSYALWGIAGAMVMRAGFVALRERRTRRSGVTGHEM